MPPSSFTDSVQRYDGERRKRDRGGAKAGDLPPLADYVGLLRNVARDRMHCHWGCSLLHGRSQVSFPSLAHEEGETAHYLHNRCIGHTPGTVRLGPPLCTQTRMPVSSKFQPAIGALVTDLLPWGTKMGNGAGLNPLHDSTPNAFVLYLAVCIRLHLQWPAQTRIPFLLPTLGQKDSKNRCDAYASLPCKWLSGGHSATVAFALSFYNRLYEGAHRRGVIILVISRSDHKSCPALLLW